MITGFYNVRRINRTISLRSYTFYIYAKNKTLQIYLNKLDSLKNIDPSNVNTYVE